MSPGGRPGRHRQQEELTGFPTLLMSNCSGTPLGIFFSAGSAAAGAEVGAGGWRVQAEGGLRHQDTMTANAHTTETLRTTPINWSGQALVLVLTPDVSWLWGCQWRRSGCRCCQATGATCRQKVSHKINEIVNTEFSVSHTQHSLSGSDWRSGRIGLVHLGLNL